jgi:hypothetical protein
MKLGFWNRLAVVAGTLFTIGVPSWFAIVSNVERNAQNHKEFEKCANQNVKDVMGWIEFCANLHLNDDGKIGWGDWLQLVALSAIAWMVLYIIVWVLARIAFWVWKGRKTK